MKFKVNPKNSTYVGLEIEKYLKINSDTIILKSLKASVMESVSDR